MSRLLVAVVIGVIGLHALPADACSCVATRIEDVTRQADVVAYAIVGAARAEANGVMSSPVTFVDVLRGVVGEQRVSWVKPDGMSCHMTSLRPGRWLLFLSWSPDGRLSVTRCDSHSRPLRDAAWPKMRAGLVAHLGAVKNDTDAVEVAGRAVRRMLVASMAGKRGTDLAAPTDGLDLARADRAIVTAQPDGSFVVRWSQNPPSGFAVDAEVRVAKDGVAHVVRATASFSPD